MSSHWRIARTGGSFCGMVWWRRTRRGRACAAPTMLFGGEQQRAALARAFALRPPILLADEPTGNLDSATGAVVLELILTLHREENATMVLVTHEQSLADCADRRIILRDGLVAS